MYFSLMVYFAFQRLNRIKHFREISKKNFAFSHNISFFPINLLYSTAFSEKKKLFKFEAYTHFSGKNDLN